MIREELNELEGLHINAIDNSFCNDTEKGEKIYNQAKEKLIQKYEGNGWISVKDRLPEGKFLSLTRRGVFEQVYYKDNLPTSHGVSHTNGFLFGWCEGERLSLDYWKPLPPPEQKEG